MTAKTSKKISSTSLIFGLLCCNAIIMYIDRTNMAVAAPVIKHAFKLDNLALGLTFSAMAFAYACFMIIGGHVGDLIGSRRGLVVCGLIWAAGTILTGLSTSLTFFVGARFLVGMGEAAVYPISALVISRWIPQSWRGTAQGTLHGCGRLGAALTPGVVTALILLSSWRWAFILLGIVSLVVTAIIWTHLRDDPRQHPGVTPIELDRLGYDAVRRGEAPQSKMVWSEFFYKIWPVTGISFSYGWFSWFLLSWVPLYFSYEHGLSLKHVALFSTMVLTGGVLGMVLGGVATDWRLKQTGSTRRARRDMILVSFLGAMLCIIPLLLSTNLTLDTSFLALGYFMIELGDPSIWMLGMEVMPSHAATSTATMNTGFALAGAVSPLIVGWLLDVTGGSWTTVFVVSFFILLIGPILVWLVRPDEQPSTPHSVMVLENIQ